MFAKIVAVAAVMAVATAGGLYGAPLLAAPAIKYTPIASSYQYEHRVHTGPIAYTTKLAPLAYAAPIAKVAAPLAYHPAPIAKVAYAAPAVHLTHHSYAPFLAAPKFYGAHLAYAPALW